MPKDDDDARRIKQLRGLVAKIEAKRQKLDDARSEVGNLFQEVEDAGFNRGALKLALKLKGWEEEKVDDFLHAFGCYCDWLGVWDQGDLFGTRPTVPGKPDVPATSDRERTPYEQGQVAFLAGANASANPFAIGGAENEAWRDGWTMQFNQQRARTRTPETVQ